ncbi:MAG TPA: hypothetical protein VK179_08740 [Bacteroidales bacterium]|nr:hypothetical protein [Bacteroidales bacterium]
MKRLFFLKNDGWTEEEISGRMLQFTQEELVLWAYAMMERKNYRNYLITENPERVLTRKIPESHVIKMPLSDVG